jgi:hypothetical protein
MDHETAGVFQYVDEGLTSHHFVNGLPPGERSASASSSGSSSVSSSGEQGDDPSFHTEEPLVGSPVASPATTQRSPAVREERGSTHPPPYHPDRFRSDSAVSVRPNISEPLGHFPGHYQQSKSEEDNEESEYEEESDTESYSADEKDETTHGHQLALERVPPPTIPPAASSGHGDAHTRRLRDLEQELRGHVLQNPQPHREFQFNGGPSPYYPPVMPLYDVYSNSGASPAGYNAPVPLPSAWPPPAPPPLPIDFYSPTQVPVAPFSPGVADHVAMATRPPMGLSNHVIQSPSIHTHQPHPASRDVTKPTKVGYELLADKLTELSRKDSTQGHGSIVPMYRKFEQVNHRVLLHLQDEISEMEEELRQLDEGIAQSVPPMTFGQAPMPSRRAEAKYGSDMHYKRTELLGRIFLKLGQYSKRRYASWNHFTQLKHNIDQALSSFGNLSKALDPADAGDIKRYRAWMDWHAPLERNETRFLEHKSDLLALSKKKTVDTVGGVGQDQPNVIWLPLIAVLPLMVFAIVPGFLGRLFIIAVIGAAEVKMVTTSSELTGLMTGREWFICASM